MQVLFEALKNEPVFNRLIENIEGGRMPTTLSGVERTHKVLIAAAAAKISQRPLLIVCADELECEKCASDMRMLSDENPLLLSAREFTFFNVENVSRQSEQQRISTLYALCQGQAQVVIATADALMQRTLPEEKLKELVFILEFGSEISLEEIEQRLLEAGYKRSEQVEGVGQFAVRGCILDIFSPAYDMPVRCELFGDEIDSMGFFDVSSQRRTENISCALVLPVAEALPGAYDGGIEGLCEELLEFAARLKKRKNSNEDFLHTLYQDIDRLSNTHTLPASDKYMSVIYRDFSSAVDYIPQDMLVMLFEPRALAERAKNYVWRLNGDTQSLITSGAIEGTMAEFYEQWQSVCEKLGERALVMLDNFTGSSYPLPPRDMLNMSAKQLPSYGGSLETAADDMRFYIREGYKTVILCADKRRCELLSSMLYDNNIKAQISISFDRLPENGQCLICVGALNAGMEFPTLKIAIMTEGQIAETGFKRHKTRKKAAANRQKLDSYADLSPGNLVVHELHGIGRFVGIFPMEVDGQRKDYIKIAYLGSDCLYVPATQLDMVSKYIGTGEDTPVKLSKLGGSDWQKTKSKAKKAAQDMAEKLVKLYAERQRLPGYAFSPDSEWQKEFEESFGYAETEDQLRCIEEIKEDMEKDTPMDRLLCGDVGYGKTEVALRAVMKCVLDGKQAAILVPTTVLAQQHYVTAMKRFAGYPIRIDVLSRFRSAAQMKASKENIKNGSADIVIGTHSLLQKDVQFKNLGLLIVDEEQRFGVSHKEKLKELSKGVDVLTLSATPIPRTLNMALAGLRDMSTIDEPPQDRHPVQTYVLEHDWGILFDAMRREISRGGQVYYMHNRVDTIERCAARISEALEGVNVAVAHGKLDEDTLSEIMENMVSGEIQVLVCTTIIETGIDIPNVNTLIIEDADKMGLSQLHQIRGRVGRSARRAFAYLTFRPGKALSDIADKRLSAIREFAEFNSGFKIAMRDLEIRGAGNLLGSEQSGHMMSVGYDMYLKLLEEAVIEQRGDRPEIKTECSADLSVSAHIPEDYVASSEQRMDLYRRIAQIRSEDDADDMTDELIDRFGDPPKAVNTLIHVALLRGEAAKAGITAISQKSGWLYMKLVDFDMEQISALYSMPQFNRRMKIEAGDTPALRLKLKSNSNVIGEAVEFIRAYSEFAHKGD